MTKLDLDPGETADWLEDEAAKAEKAASESEQPSWPHESFPTPIAPIEALGPDHALPLPEVKS